MINIVGGTLWQWSIGRQVVITPKEGYTINKVEYANGIIDHAVKGEFETQKDGSIISTIPPVLLQYANNLTVYAVSANESLIQTTEAVTFNVNVRAKPEDYIFTDDEIRTYQVYEERLKYLENNIVVPEKLNAEIKKEVDSQVPNWAQEEAPDVTLTLEGKAADAKIVGDNVVNLTQQIAAEKVERQQEIDVERKRINNLASLPDGSTTGDAEIIDARIGANGEEYPNLGTAIRKQFKHTDSIFELFQNETKSIAPTITQKTMWKITDGVVERAATTSTGYCLCEPIEVEESTMCEVTVKSYATAVNSIIVVDENYMVLYFYNANLTEEIATTFRIPIGAKYLLLNTVFPTSLNPAPTVTITSYEKTVAEETVVEIKNKAEYLWENSSQYVSKINATIKERRKRWEVENGKIIYKDGTSDAHIACTEIPVKFGQIITVMTKINNPSDTFPTFAVVDSNYNILYKSTQLEETVVVPFGSAFVVVNAFSVVSYSAVTIRDIDILRGKTVAVIGDSISTKIDLNAVEMTITEEDVGVELSAYLTYYDVNTNALSLGGHTFTAAEIGTEVTFTPNADDVGKVIGSVKNYNDANNTTWWEVAQEELGFSTIPVCWSGASITSHESNTDTLKCAHAWHESQVRKCGIRTPGTMERTSPDMIIIFRGCNDMTHEPYSKLTNDYFDNVNFEYPETDELSDGGWGFKEGYVLLISKLRERYPDAKIFLCTLSVFKRVNCSKFPTNNGINTLPQYNNAIREIADYMGCGLIEFDKCGITFENCYSEGYIVDSQTTPTHPSVKGHMLMANKAMHDLKEQYIKV